MTEKPAKPFSPAMASALRAVARRKGDSEIIWSVLLESERNDRYAPIAEPDPLSRRAKQRVIGGYGTVSGQENVVKRCRHKGVNKRGINSLLHLGGKFVPKRFR